MFRKLVLSALLVCLLAGCSPQGSSGELSTTDTARYTQTQLDEFKVAKESLSPTTDSIEGITRYRDSRAQAYVDVKSAIVPSISQRDGEAPKLLLRYQYVGFSWIFWQSLVVAIDDRRLTGEFSYTDIKRDNSGGKVWEYYTQELNDSGIEMLEEMVSSTSTTIRFKGDRGTWDLVLTEEDKAMVKTTLEGYKWLLWDYESNR